MAKIDTVLLFEDNEAKRKEIVGLLKAERNDVVIHEIDEDIAQRIVSSNEEVAFEEQLENSIKNDYPNTDLILVDHDLTRFKSSLSEPVINSAALRNSIPVCRYHRRPQHAQDEINMHELTGSVFAITVKLDNTIAKEVLNILDGFKQLREAYIDLQEDDRNKGPSSSVAKLLNKSGAASHLSMYTTGISFVTDLLKIKQTSAGSPNIKSELEKRFPYIYGYWLHNSILKFPGVILNEIATASYLNISLDKFNDSEIKDCFNKAKYDGPFSGVHDYWWRLELDEILEEDRLIEVLKVCGITEEVEPCRCSVTGQAPAGYYDIFTHQPISLDASKGNLGWIPKGADLTRANIELYNELAPILNI